jgi:hypothetical protein
VSLDLHVLVRQSIYTYDLFFYVNADERRETDCYWRPAYTIVTWPLIRNMIDCLHNITAILQDPAVKGSAFRKSGFRMFAAFDEDAARYGGQPKWDEWIARNRDFTDLAMPACGLTRTEVLAQHLWATRGTYIATKGPGGTTTPHQKFLRTFSLGAWREYSAMAHGAFEGLMRVAMYNVRNRVLIAASKRAGISTVG